MSTPVIPDSLSDARASGLTADLRLFGLAWAVGFVFFLVLLA